MSWLRCALGALLLFSFHAIPATAQQGGNRLAGRWQCNSGIQGQPAKRLVSVVTRYVLVLYQNATFAAQGVIRAGVVSSTFQARGRWGVQRQGNKYFVAGQGQQVVVQSEGGRYRRPYSFFAQVYSFNNLGHRSRLQNGSNFAVTCQRG